DRRPIVSSWVNGRTSFAFRAASSGRPALQSRKEETVGSRGGRAENDAALVEAGSIHCLREPGTPQMRRFDEREVRVTGQKRFHLPLVLPREDRAGEVGQPAAWLHEGAGLFEYLRLLAQPHIELTLGKPPFRIRPPPPCPAAGAGRVDEHEI